MIAIAKETGKSRVSRTMSNARRALLPTLAALILAGGIAHAGEGWGYFDFLVPEVVGETGSRTYDLNQKVDKDTTRFIGNQTVKGGTFIGGGFGVQGMYVFPSGVLVGLGGGAWGGRLHGADIPWESQSIATHYEVVTRLGYAFSVGIFSLHAAALVGFDGMSFDVSGPVSGFASNTAMASSGSTSTDGGLGYTLSRFDLRAGVQLGVHFNVTEMVAVFADGSYDYDGQWRVRGGISIGQPKKNCF